MTQRAFELTSNPRIKRYTTPEGIVGGTVGVQPEVYNAADWTEVPWVSADERLAAVSNARPIGPDGDRSAYLAYLAAGRSVAEAEAATRYRET